MWFVTSVLPSNPEFSTRVILSLRGLLETFLVVAAGENTAYLVGRGQDAAKLATGHGTAPQETYPAPNIDRLGWKPCSGLSRGHCSFNTEQRRRRPATDYSGTHACVALKTHSEMQWEPSRCVRLALSSSDSQLSSGSFDV